MRKQNTSRKYPRQTHPIPAIGAFILNNKNQILLVKSFKWEGYYCVPGGRVEIGEKIEHTVKREVKEEVGLDVTNIKFLCVADAIFPKEFFKKRHFIFLDYLCLSKGNQTPKLDKDEIQSYIWIDLKESLKLNLEPYGRNTIKNYIIPYLKKIIRNTIQCDS